MIDSIRRAIEASEAAYLAPYASKSAESRGRACPEAEHPYRTAFQRDRDKVLYSTAFRRLQYKTQVFVNFEGDHYRTRLTHTLEAAQIGRTIARALRCNEDLVEAITLAHDLGHPPFGHASEEALDALMRRPETVDQLRRCGDPGGFDHNRQSLRILDHLEGHHPERRGLNVSWEVREGVAKRHSTEGIAQLAELRETSQPSLEAQIANLADEIAYNCHDIEDGMRAGIIRLEDLHENPLWVQAMVEVSSRYGDVPRLVLESRTVHNVIDRLVTDAIVTTQQNLERWRIRTVDDVRGCVEPLVGLSESVAAANRDLKHFLYTRVYYHYQVARMKEKAKRLVTQIFETYLARPNQLPEQVQERLEAEPLPRVLCDYIAGMTDRFAVDEHRRLFEIDIRLLP